MKKTGWLLLPVAMLFGTSLAQTPDPAMGKWKLNVEKSSFPFGPGPKSQTITMEPSGKGVKWTNEVVNQAGATTTIEWVGQTDGKEFPIKGNQNADTGSMKRVNSRTVVQTNKKGGEVMQINTREVSRDGKTMISTNAFTSRYVFMQAAGNAPVKVKDSAIGTWDLALDKSRIAGALPKSMTVTLSPEGNGLKSVSTGVNAAGAPTKVEYTANYDGKDYPVKGSRIIDTVSLKRVNASTVKRTDKKDGQVVAEQSFTVSSDGKTMTNAYVGYQRAVFERQ